MHDLITWLRAFLLTILYHALTIHHQFLTIYWSWDLFDLYTQGSTTIRLMEDTKGRTHDYLHIMAKFIQALREHFLRTHDKSITDTTQILWVVTVPAVWSEQAKGFMREAAEKVDIAKHLWVNKILLWRYIATQYKSYFKTGT